MSGRPRTLSEWLRRQDDGWLARLLQLRPDAAIPAASDLSVLAGRLAVRVSISRVLDELDAWTLQVLDGLILSAAPVSVAEVVELSAGATVDQVTDAVQRLRERALIWGDDDQINVVGAVRESASKYPAGLGRPIADLLANYYAEDLRVVQRAHGLPAAPPKVGVAAIAGALQKPIVVQTLLEEAPQGSRALLESLNAGIPVGEVPELVGVEKPTAESSPVRWLLGYGLLAFIGNSYVELPREVGLVLRGEAPLGRLKTGPGPMLAEQVDPDVVDSTAGAHLLEALRELTVLLDAVGQDAPRVLKSGGLGAREAKRLTKTTGIEPANRNLLLHIAAEADLLAHTSYRTPEWLPTTRFDSWREEPPEQQWPVIAQAWIRMHSYPWLAGEQASVPGMAPINALAPELDRPGAPAARRRLLEAMLVTPPGAALGVDDLVLLLRWRNPRRFSPSSGVAADHALREAEYLGITGRGVLSSPARLVVQGAPDAEVSAAVRAAVPEPVDYFLLQADLTAVAPGRLVPEVGRQLAAVADIESSGGASVYRITEATIRRALDTGHTAAELHDFFASRSRTPVPQTLAYLVDDAARRHGVLRLGPATAYLRCDDESTLSTIVGDRRLEHLELRRLAPGVVLSTARPEALLSELREAGYAPSLESSGGVLRMEAPELPRAPGRRHLRPDRISALDEATADELVRKIRAGDEAAEIGRRVTNSMSTDLPGVTTASTLEVLNQATAAGRQLSLDYVDSSGQASSRLVTPSSVTGGFLHAYDHGRSAARTFAIHRIVSVTTV